MKSLNLASGCDFLSKTLRLGNPQKPPGISENVSVKDKPVKTVTQ
jgi:hypothetical protein